MRYPIAQAPIVRQVAARYELPVKIEQELTAQETRQSKVFGTPEYRGIRVKRYISIPGAPASAHEEILALVAASNPSPT